jgi:hypothetical protein
MKVQGLDGRQHSWSLTGYRVNANSTRPRSTYHLAARSLLTEMFPVIPILEEVWLPGSGNLRLDFYLPQKKMAVEVHGEQHYGEAVHYFHRGKGGFNVAMHNDGKKREWCELNDIRLVVLKYSDGEDEWKRQISGRES